MDVAGQHSNLAMMLIGQCSHDDVLCANLEKNEEPKGNARFRQGSLGADAIVPNELVAKIASIQAPDEGAGSLTSKYYHTLVSTYNACALVREGVPSFIVDMVTTVAANTYRMMRLCKSIDSPDMPFFKSAEEIYDNIEKGVSPDSMARNLAPQNAGKMGREKERLPEFAYTKKYLKETLKINLADSSAVSSALKELLSFADASRLFRSSVLKTGEKCVSPQLTFERINKMEQVANDPNLRCGNDLSAERCKQAKNRLLTWWVDFEWTLAQHKQGAKFASNNCKVDPEFIKNLDQHACAALDQYKKRATGGEGDEIGSEGSETEV